MELTENKIKCPRVILVSADTGEFDAERSMAELEELAKTAGVEVAATVVFARAHTAVAWGAAWHTARTATIAGRAEVAARVVVLTAFHFHRTASSVAAEVVIAAKHAAIAS